MCRFGNAQPKDWGTLAINALHHLNLVGTGPSVKGTARVPRSGAEGGPWSSRTADPTRAYGFASTPSRCT